MHSEFRKWLEAQEYGTGTVAAQIHRAGRVEKYYGSLEECFRRDRLASVITALRYSIEDERAGRPNSSKIPFRGNPRTNLASYRNAIGNYVRFLTEREPQGGAPVRIEQKQTRPVPIMEIIRAGETGGVEFKSTLRTNTHTGQKDTRIELAVLKTIAAFLNRRGGTLVIGVKDNGAAVGVEADQFLSEDGMNLHLINLVKDHIGAAKILNIEPEFDSYEGVRVLVVKCSPSNGPVFVRDGPNHRFYVRFGPSTQELSGADQVEYIKQRF